jgi:hypothetical protein
MRSSYSRRPVADDRTLSPKTLGGMPKVYSNKRHRVFFGKYVTSDGAIHADG